MELGYFAQSPAIVQNHLLPVYRVKGTVSTTDFPRHDFDYYIIAVKYNDHDVRSLGVSIEGKNAMVF